MSISSAAAPLAYRGFDFKLWERAENSLKP